VDKVSGSDFHAQTETQPFNNTTHPLVDVAEVAGVLGARVDDVLGGAGGGYWNVGTAYCEGACDDGVVGVKTQKPVGAGVLAF